MESYEAFIQRHCSGEGEEEPRTPVPPPSVIVFHGAPVLPPLLNEQQRHEMRRLRETAVSLMKRRREEESHSSFTDDIISAPPALTSTAQDGQSANQLRASPETQSLESTQITVLFEGRRSHDAHDGHSHSQMMSSGYVTNDNTDVTCQSGWIEAAATVTTGSDIISHAPVDGAILEEEEEEDASVKEAVDPPSDPDEGPYRMSLQNLLKKSQEYRRRQRLLRARAKDESDKENEELPKQTWRTELRMAREKRKSEEDQAQIAELPVTARALYASKQKTGVSRSATGRRFSSVPMPKFCMSPVRCKKRSGIPGPLRKALSESDRRPNILHSSRQTEQIAQLELNLSSLRELISDLESTLTQHTGSPAGTHGVMEDHGVGRENWISPSAEDTRRSSERTHADDSGSPLIGSSYDVDAPSGLWSQLTPEMGGHEGGSRVKRRLLMNESELETNSTPKEPAGQLTEDECRRQQDLLQSLALRYQFLRSVSFLCPSAGSRLEDTPTSVCTHTESTDAPAPCLPLLAAVVKGFLTRRLLRTERVSRLIRTIQDTQVFLLSLQHQTSISSRNDRMLQERVTLQLRAARQELHQLFFSSSASERMGLIRQDRERRREQRLRAHMRPKASLSAATRKALERKKLVMIQQKSADRKQSSPSNEEKWKLVPKICRVSKKTLSVRGAP